MKKFFISVALILGMGATTAQTTAESEAAIELENYEAGRAFGDSIRAAGGYTLEYSTGYACEMLLNSSNEDEFMKWYNVLSSNAEIEYWYNVSGRAQIIEWCSIPMFRRVLNDTDIDWFCNMDRWIPEQDFFYMLALAKLIQAQQEMLEVLLENTPRYGLWMYPAWYKFDTRNNADSNREVIDEIANALEDAGSDLPWFDGALKDHIDAAEESLNELEN